MVICFGANLFKTRIRVADTVDVVEATRHRPLLLLAAPQMAKVVARYAGAALVDLVFGSLG